MKKLTTLLLTLTASVIVCTAVEIPFRGNTYVTQSTAEPSHIIDTQTGAILQWNSPSTVLSLYFKVSNAGTFDLSFTAANLCTTKQSVLETSCNGVSKTIKVKSTDTLLYKAGRYTVTEPGYVKVDIRGLKATPERGEFARIDKFFVEGTAVEGKNNFVPTERLADCYWYRRGPSVHFGYEIPRDSVEWFYNEVTVPEGADVPGTYFMLTGFSEGYMGIQSISGGGRKVLFSVWSPFTTDNPKEIPAEDRVQTLRRGELVRAQDFGGEGSGGQSFMDYPWKTGQTYKTLVNIKPDGKGNTVYTGYFCDENGKWHLLASFLRPRTNTYYHGAHSFLECFIPETSFLPRRVEFRNQWACMADGKWVEVTKGVFTCDGTGLLGVRADMSGQTTDDGAFVLANCGFTPATTAYRTQFSRKAGNQPPVIDFNSLLELK